MNALNANSRRAIEWIAGELLTDAFREALREEVRAAVADAHADEVAQDRPDEDAAADADEDSSGRGLGRTLGKLVLVGAGVAVAAYLVRSRTGAAEDLLGDGEVETGTDGTVNGAGQWGDDGSDREVGGAATDRTGTAADADAVAEHVERTDATAQGRDHDLPPNGGVDNDPDDDGDDSEDF